MKVDLGAVGMGLMGIGLLVATIAGSVFTDPSVNLFSYVVTFSFSLFLVIIGSTLRELRHSVHFIRQLSELRGLLKESQMICDEYRKLSQINKPQ